jgi:hypothetical protein
VPVTRRLVLLCAVLPSFLLFFQATPATAQNPPLTASSDSGSSPRPKATGSNANGRTAVDRLMQALGGAGKVNAARTLHQTLTIVQQGQTTMVDQSIVYPDKQVQTISVAQGEPIRIVVTPNAAFMVKGPLVRDLPPSQRTSSDAALKHDFLNVLQHIGDPKYTFSARAKQSLGSVEAIVVDVSADGAQTRWWIGPDGKLLQEQFSEIGQTGSTTQLMKYSDWKKFDGLEYPAKYEVFDEAGQLRLSMTLVRMEVNAAVDPDLFEKPRR